MQLPAAGEADGGVETGTNSAFELLGERRDGREARDEARRFDVEPVTLNSLVAVAAAPKDAHEVPPRTRVPSGIRVRLFEARDREEARVLLRQHHANTVFRDQPFSDWKFDRNRSQVLSRPPRMAGIVAECENRVIGLAWAVADSYLLSDGPLFVTVQLIAVELEKIGPVRRAKTFLALVSGIRQWAQSMNATHSFVHVTTGSNLKATDRLMKAAGAKCVGGAYVV
jgi:hypothetical protein